MIGASAMRAAGAALFVSTMAACAPSHPPYVVHAVRAGEPSFVRTELNVTFYDRGVATALSRVFREDLAAAREVTYDDWRRRGASRVLEWFVLPARDRF